MKPSFALVALALPLTAQTQFRVPRNIDFPAGPQVMFAAGDIDGDGSVDVVAAGDFGRVRVLLNDGRGRFRDDTTGRLLTPLVTDNHAVSLADIDGDGDLDLLVGNEDGLPNRVYLNNGLAFFTDVTSTALPPNSFDTKNHVVADFDNDGDLDWLAVDFGGCHLYANNGLGVFTDVSATALVGVATTLGAEWLTVPPATDLDGDGFVDVLVPGTGGLLRNVGGVLSPFPSQLPAYAIAPHWLADVDGDGRMDIFAGSGRFLFRNLGGGTFVDITATAFPTVPVTGYACFDIDDDGDADVVGPSAIWVNDGRGAFVAMPGLPGLNNLYANAIADYDGDGDLEFPLNANMLRQIQAPVPMVRGSTYVLEVFRRPGSVGAVAIFGALDAGSQRLPFGDLRLDPATAVTLAVRFGMPSQMGLPLQIPNNPALVGTALHYQAIVEDPLVGLVLTNAIREVLQ